MTTPTTQFLDRPDGRISYDDNGIDGPLVIAAPGMGDTRNSYRHLRDGLAAEGIRFVTMDVRGMGESSVDWSDVSDAAVASDYLALVDELGGGPAVLVGNSLSCASSVIAATDAPEKVSGVMLLGPFVRDVPMAWWKKAAFGAMLSPPWGRSVWVSYYRKSPVPGCTTPGPRRLRVRVVRQPSRTGPLLVVPVHVDELTCRVRQANRRRSPAGCCGDGYRRPRLPRPRNRSERTRRVDER